MSLNARVIQPADAEVLPQKEADGYAAKVVKYIPAQMVAAYVAAHRILETSNSTEDPDETMLWILLIVGLIVTPLWVLFATIEKDENGKPLPLPGFQAGVAAVAFVIWAFALGGPFAEQDWYEPVQGQLLLIFATLLIPIVENVYTRFKPSIQKLFS